MKPTQQTPTDTEPPKPAHENHGHWHPDRQNDHRRASGEGDLDMPTRPDRLLRAALAAADLGLYVFPVAPRSKTPAIRDWEHAATRAAEQITHWWSERPFNIGAATGPSDVVVLDLDTARGERPPPEFAGAADGLDVLIQIARAAGQQVPLDTYRVSTPSGGSHLYFRAPAESELRNTAGALGWKIDTRAQGGYVVAAGSVGPQGLYTVAERRPMAELPAWIASALTPMQPPPQVGQGPEVEARHVGAYVRAIVEREAAEVAAAAVGQRHYVRLKAARTLGQLIGGGDLDEGSAVHALRDAAAVHIGHDCTLTEVEADLRDGLAYGRRLPRRISRKLPRR